MVKRTKELEQKDDLQLRLLILSGDEVASSCLFRRYQQEIKVFLLSRGCPAEDIDDVTIITLQKIWKALDTYDNNAGANFKTWAFTIAKNTFLDWNKVYNLPEDSQTDLETAIDHTTPESSLIEKERQMYVESLLEQLSDLDQTILSMKGAGLKYEEIAQKLNISLSIVKNRLHQAKLKLINLSQDARND